jgi:hypothetical protein
VLEQIVPIFREVRDLIACSATIWVWKMSLSSVVSDLEVWDSTAPSFLTFPMPQRPMPSDECAKAKEITRRFPQYRRMEEHLTCIAIVLCGRMQPRTKEVINGIADCLCQIRGQRRPGRIERRQKRAMIAWFCENVPQLVNMRIGDAVGMLNAIGFVLPWERKGDPEQVTEVGNELGRNPSDACPGAKGGSQLGLCAGLTGDGLIGEGSGVGEEAEQVVRLDAGKWDGDSRPFGMNNWFL